MGNLLRNGVPLAYLGLQGEVVDIVVGSSLLLGVQMFLAFCQTLLQDSDRLVACDQFPFVGCLEGFELNRGNMNPV